VQYGGIWFGLITLCRAHGKIFPDVRNWKPGVGKVTFKSNGDEALNDEFLFKSNGDEVPNDFFLHKK
jgi:hypothetical protein